MRNGRLLVSMTLAAVALSSAPGAIGSAAVDPIDYPVPIDCAGPAPEAEPGTSEWDARDAANMFCAEQRHLDQPMHPAGALPLPGAPYDAYREPSRHDGIRFRFDAVTIEGLDAEVYRPCAAGSCSSMSDGLRTFEPPYPAVVVVHGGASHKELHWWSSQPLAENGYMVVAFDSAGISPTRDEAVTVLDWLVSAENPFREELDAARIGIAGHSAGGVIASSLGQQDERITALVSWDRAQSGRMPEDLVIRNPALFLFADYNCQQVPVCQPTRYETQPDPDGPGNKSEDFQRVRTAGVDTMQIGLRAALHLDFVPSELSGNRYAELVTMHYTIAWFDRYLKGIDDPGTAADAYARLTASVFDGGADGHNLSQGFYDPVLAATSADVYGGNVPYAIDGMPVADRLSFYYLSKCFLTMPGSSERATSDDMRALGCTGSDAAVGHAAAAGAPVHSHEARVTLT
ncbi:MAG TPA: alpha/beta fold hydrolase [Actinomycetota bacterium]